jgi:hypothetical protein
LKFTGRRVAALFVALGSAGGLIWRAGIMVDMKTIISKAVLVLASLALGCGRTAPPAANSVAPAGGSYTYEVRSVGSRTFGTAENIDAQANDITLSIHGGRLKVNNKDYGQLKNGDSVLADESGKVLINGEERERKD